MLLPPRLLITIPKMDNDIQTDDLGRHSDCRFESARLCQFVRHHIHILLHQLLDCYISGNRDDFGDQGLVQREFFDDQCVVGRAQVFIGVQVQTDATE